MNIQLLGLCRFSYPSEVGAFKRGSETLKGLCSVLYSAERLEQRLFFFERLVLPALREQSDKDFTLLVLAGDQLPTDFRRRLELLCSGLPQIQLVFEPEGQNHRDLCRKIMVHHRDMSADIVGEFRLDDDDAVAIDFVERTKKLIEGSYEAFEDTFNHRMGIDYTRGILLAFDHNGLRGMDVQERQWTPAQVYCRLPEDEQSILDLPHAASWQNMLTLSVPSARMFVRGAHAENDSDVLSRPKYRDHLVPLRDEIKDRLRIRFAIEASVLEAVWDSIRCQ